MKGEVSIDRCLAMFYNKLSVYQYFVIINGEIRMYVQNWISPIELTYTCVCMCMLVLWISHSLILHETSTFLCYII